MIPRLPDWLLAHHPSAVSATLPSEKNVINNPADTIYFLQ
jgi:hypothetical protein